MESGMWLQLPSVSLLAFQGRAAAPYGSVFLNTYDPLRYPPCPASSPSTGNAMNQACTGNSLNVKGWDISYFFGSDF